MLLLINERTCRLPLTSSDALRASFGHPAKDYNRFNDVTKKRTSQIEKSTLSPSSTPLSSPPTMEKTSRPRC